MSNETRLNESQYLKSDILSKIKNDPYNITNIKQLLSAEECSADFLSDTNFAKRLVSLNGCILDFLPTEMRNNSSVVYFSLISSINTSRVKNVATYVHKVFSDERLTIDFSKDMKNTYVGIINNVKESNQNAIPLVNKYKEEYKEVMQVASSQYEIYTQRKEFKQSAINDLPEYQFGYSKPTEQQ